MCRVFEAKMANAKAKESGDEVKPPTPPDAKPVAPTTKSEAPAAFVPKEIGTFMLCHALLLYGGYVWS